MNVPLPTRLRRAGIPLSAKIAFCFAVNILVIVGAAFWLLRVHFGFDRDWLLTRDARARLQTLTVTLLDELEGTPASQWDGLLERFGGARDVSLALFENGGRQLAGPAIELPPPVRLRLTGGRGGFRPGSAPDRPFEGWQPRNGRQRGDERPPPFVRDGAPDRGPPIDRRRDILRRLPEFPKEAFRTDEPRRYWFLVRVPLSGQPRTSLVGMTESLGQSGLLFDPKPWLWTAVAVMGVSILLWSPLIHGLTRALSHMTAATDEISRGNFDTRVDERRRDELGRLGGAINRMTERLGGFVTGQKRFLGDVAHELCAPLARLEMGLGVLDQRAPESLRRRIDDVRDEAREMNALVAELLSFSKAGMQSSAPPREPVALAPIVQAAVSREASGVDVRVDVSDDLHVLGVAPLLQRALANLLRNAVRHAGAAGPIQLTASRRGDLVAITVADHGPGVPPESLPHLFEPFYRVDLSRTRETGGAGLGLAIVKTCAEACGGSVSAENRAAGGFAVTVSVAFAAPPETGDGDPPPL